MSFVLTPATVPEGTLLPESAQELLNMAAAGLIPSGFEDLEGILVQVDEPTPEERDGRAWLKLDASTNRPLGLFTYDGEWVQTPTIIPNGDTEPSDPQSGELFFNTDENALKIYKGGAWTTNFRHEGTTGNRPSSPATGYLYFDTSISRLIRYSVSGWTTDDGFVGELRMCADVSEADALARNPGWEVYEAMADRFPIGRSDDIAIGEEGGRDSFEWSAIGNAAQGGARDQGVLRKIAIDGTSLTALASPSDTTASGSVPIVPPYKGVLFLKKIY
jgi:hypothetical protein